MSPKTLLASISPACLEAEIEFVGVTNDSKETKIALADTATGASKWVKISEQFDGFTVVSYDETTKSVLLRKEGSELKVTLKEVKIAPPPPPEPPQIIEYIVKLGDGGAKIAHEQGITLADLQVLNPGVNWTKLKVGMKIRIK
jgi:LysM repeat protein